MSVGIDEVRYQSLALSVYQAFYIVFVHDSGSAYFHNASIVHHYGIRKSEGLITFNLQNGKRRLELWAFTEYRQMDTLLCYAVGAIRNIHVAGFVYPDVLAYID